MQSVLALIDGDTVHIMANGKDHYGGDNIVACFDPSCMHGLYRLPNGIIAALGGEATAWGQRFLFEYLAKLDVSEGLWKSEIVQKAVHPFVLDMKEEGINLFAEHQKSRSNLFDCLLAYGNTLFLVESGLGVVQLSSYLAFGDVDSTANYLLEPYSHEYGEPREYLFKALKELSKQYLFLEPPYIYINTKDGEFIAAEGEEE